MRLSAIALLGRRTLVVTPGWTHPRRKPGCPGRLAADPEPLAADE
jgi:hypothetical protein